MTTNQKLDILFTVLAFVALCFKLYIVTFIFAIIVVVLMKNRTKVTAYDKYGTNDIFEICKIVDKQKEKDKKANELSKRAIQLGYDSDDLYGIILANEELKKDRKQ